MSKIVDRLLEEHAHMRRVLGLLSGEMASFRTGETADYHLLQEIADYVLDFPDQSHHPREDAIHRMMTVRGHAFCPLVAELEGLHRKLAGRARHFYATMERVMRDETLSRDLVLDVVGSFVEGYLAHMADEEAYFFPEALRLLSVADWHELEADFNDVRDPLRSTARDRRFEQLRDSILSSQFR